MSSATFVDTEKLPLNPSESEQEINNYDVQAPSNSTRNNSICRMAIPRKVEGVTREF